MQGPAPRREAPNNPDGGAEPSGWQRPRSCSLSALQSPALGRCRPNRRRSSPQPQPQSAWGVTQESKGCATIARLGAAHAGASPRTRLAERNRRQRVLSRAEGSNRDPTAVMSVHGRRASLVGSARKQDRAARACPKGVQEGFVFGQLDHHLSVQVRRRGELAIWSQGWRRTNQLHTYSRQAFLV